MKRLFALALVFGFGELSVACSGTEAPSAPGSTGAQPGTGATGGSDLVTGGRSASGGVASGGNIGGYIGWMRWRFMGDQAGHDMFVGADCQICADATFSAVVKTSTFDSL